MARNLLRAAWLWSLPRARLHPACLVAFAVVHLLDPVCEPRLFARNSLCPLVLLATFRPGGALHAEPQRRADAADGQPALLAHRRLARRGLVRQYLFAATPQCAFI